MDRRALEEARPLGDEYAARRLDYRQLRATLCERYPILSPEVMDMTTGMPRRRAHKVAIPGKANAASQDNIREKTTTGGNLK